MTASAWHELSDVEATIDAGHIDGDLKTKKLFLQSMTWLSPRENPSGATILAKPWTWAKRSKGEGDDDTSEGQANASLVRLVASSLGVAPTKVRITKGRRSGLKTLEVEGLTEANLHSRLKF
jgi:hypothetical protein